MSRIHVVYSFPLRLGTPGTGTTAWHQVTGLLHKGIKVRLYAGSCEKPIHGLDGLKETFVSCGIKLPIRLIRLLCSKRPVELHDKLVAKAIRKIHKKSKIDLVHCWPSGALETLKTASEFGIKTVLERPSSHTRYVFEVMEQECKKLGIKLKKPHYATCDERRLTREEREFALADKLLCPSEFVAKTFLEKGFRSKQLARHHYGYDPAVFPGPDASPIKRDRSSFTVVYVGQCNPLKGLHIALKAWLKSEASKNGKFYICGEFVPPYEQLLKELLVHPSVKHLGFVESVAKLMQRCDALILPSLAEGSALVTYEARACGCILLVSEATGAVCEHMKDSLIHKPGDVDTLRDHIDLLARDLNLRDRLRANSLAGASSLTWADAAKNMIQCYQEILNVGS